MKILILASVVSFFLTGFFIPSHAASTKHWRESFKAAEEARNKRDFENARTILEGLTTEASELGLESSARTVSLLAEVYVRLEMHDEAVKMLDAEIAKIGPKPKTREALVYHGIFLALRALVALETNQFDQAIAFATQARDEIEQIAGRFHPEMFRLHNIIGFCHRQKKNYAEAEKAYQLALKLAETPNFGIGVSWTGPEESSNMYQLRSPKDGVVQTATVLANLCLDQQKYAEAEGYAKKALKSAEAGLGKQSPFVVMALAPLTYSQLKQGKLRDFERDTDRLYELVTKHPGFEPSAVEPLWLRFETEFANGNLDKAASAARKIAGAYDAQNYETAELGSRALAIGMVNNAPDWNRIRLLHEQFSKAISAQYPNDPLHLGQVHLAFGRYANEAQNTEFATQLFEELAKTQQNAPDKGLLISALSKIAETKLAQNKPAEALPLRQQITALMRQKYGEDTRVADAMEDEANVLKQTGQEQAAIDLQKKAAELRGKAVLK